MQESNYALSLQTDVDELNNHPVLVYITNHTDFFEFTHWKDETTNMYYCKVTCESDIKHVTCDSTRFFYKFNDLDEFFINKVMYIYNKLLAN